MGLVCLTGYFGAKITTHFQRSLKTGKHSQFTFIEKFKQIVNEKGLDVEVVWRNTSSISCSKYSKYQM